MIILQYPFCARCGKLLYRGIGCTVRTEQHCSYCDSYKIKKNGKVSWGMFYQNPDPKIIYMDFEYDMEQTALEKISQTKNNEWDWEKEWQIKKDFKQACEDFFNNIIVNNPDFSPAVREEVLKDDERREKEKIKEQEKKEKLHEEYKKKREAEKAYEATHPKPKCPTCGSTNVEKISTANRMVSVGILGLASDKIGKQFCCKNCGYKW